MRLRISIGLLVVAALFPLTVGGRAFFYLLLSTDYSAAMPSSYVDAHVSYTNLIATAVSWIVLATFGLGKRLAWAWFFLLFSVLFVGLSDTFAIYWRYREGGVWFPFPIFPTTLGVLGLALSFKEVFSHKRGHSSDKVKV